MAKYCNPNITTFNNVVVTVKDIARFLGFLNISNKIINIINKNEKLPKKEEVNDKNVCSKVIIYLCKVVVVKKYVFTILKTKKPMIK